LEAWINTAVAGGIGLIGVGLGYLGSLRLSRREREAAGRDELRRAFARYLGALYPVVSELRQTPQTRRRPPGTVLERLQGPAWTFVSSRRGLTKAFGSRPFDLGDRLADAVAAIQVLALPQDVDQAISAANDYVEHLAEQRSDTVKAEWPGIHARLMDAARSIESRDS
jgi:hypothetical protein